MRPQAFSSALVYSAIFSAFCGIAACGGGAVEGSPSTTPSASATQSAEASTDSGSAADATLADATTSTTTTPTTTFGSLTPDGGKTCGCKLCAPVVSDDTCSRDADCLPESPCHATRCVAKAHATPRNPDIMCTENMRCDSTDANACGCVKGKCTLSPR